MDKITNKNYIQLVDELYKYVSSAFDMFILNNILYRIESRQLSEIMSVMKRETHLVSSRKN